MNVIRHAWWEVMLMHGCVCLCLLLLSYWWIQIVKKTLIAAMDMDYPADKITICLCDDGNSPGE